MNWFRRKPAPPAKPIRDLRNMNEDWAVGDLAQCIDGNWPDTSQANPKVGDVLRVAEVIDGTTRPANYRAYGLGFSGKPSNIYWECTAFRKLRPATTEFSEQMKALRPIKPKAVAPCQETL
jgi:hypothetical protein